jgi:Ca-activated chloride channel family protein
MRRFFKIFNIVIIVFIVLAWSFELLAVGVLFSRPRFSDQEFQKMWIKKVETTVEIQDQIAVTHVDQVFFNEMNTSVEAVYVFPLPENAMITELVYWFNGQRYVAEIRERQEAIKDYNQKLRQWLDPALLEYLGNNLFRLRIVPVNAQSEVRTEITYVEPLEYDLGKVNYTFLLNTLGLSPKPLETVLVQVDAYSQTFFKSFESPSHKNSSATQINMISENHYRLIFGDENFYPDKDLQIFFQTSRAGVDMRVLTYTPVPADSFGTNSFYAIWITPPDNIADAEIIPKDIIFTADVSSSMEGTRMVQVKEALNHFIDLLQPYDRFNIVTFGTFVQKFRPDLVAASEAHLEGAREFIFQMYALGLTNIDEALQASLQQYDSDTTSNNLIFLTDGEPTWGETNLDSILGHVERRNKHDVRIFSFGVGEEISEALLTRVSRMNHGYAQFITSDDSIALVVNNHFSRISKPVMKDIQIDMEGLQTWDIYPKTQEDLFWGSQVMRLGLYQNGGFHKVSLSGEMRSEVVSYSKIVHFPDTLGGHRFIPRLWAQAKIDNIMELITIYGETDELVNQIIELSLRFQILTQYTALYSDPTEETTAIDKNQNLPNSFALFQNYPNPFNPETMIRYRLPTDQTRYHVTIKIYDLLGRLILVLQDENQIPGEYSVRWNGRDAHDQLVPSGVYIYTIRAGSFSATRKMVLLR